MFKSKCTYSPVKSKDESQNFETKKIYETHCITMLHKLK